MWAPLPCPRAEVCVYVCMYSGGVGVVCVSLVYAYVCVCVCVFVFVQHRGSLALSQS